MSEMVERFWAKVDRRGPCECWNWTGSSNLNRCGQRYGSIRVGTMKRAHRVSYEIAHGSIPAGLVVRHRCDNTLCVNPDHLEIGTQAENVQDRYDRSRAFHQRGEGHGNAKLTAESVREIRRALESGESQRAIAMRFGVSQFGVRHARDGWQHV